MKKFFRRLFGIKSPAEKLLLNISKVFTEENLAKWKAISEEATETLNKSKQDFEKLRSQLPERDENGKWIYSSKHPAGKGRKPATLDLNKCKCNGEGCKCKNSQS